MSGGSKPSLILKEEGGIVNYMPWKRNWELCFASYGTAGEELQLNQQIRANVPMPAAVGRQDEWNKAEERYKTKKGQLMANIQETIGASLLVDIQNRPMYDQIIRTTDHFGLWNLIQTVVLLRGGSQDELKNRWENLFQEDKPLRDHIQMFEHLYANIDLTLIPIPERNKTIRLAKSVNHDRYEVITKDVLLLSRRPPPAQGEIDHMPRYNDFKDNLISYESILENEEKRKPEKSPSASKSVAMFAKSSSSKDVVCYNCGEQGHYAKLCPNPPKCGICGEGHRTDRHSSKETRNQSVTKHESIVIPKGYKLVRDPAYNSSSGSSSKVTSSGNKSSKHVHKKPFEIKPKEKIDKSKKYKKVYLTESGDYVVDDDDVSESQSDHDSDSDLSMED